MCIYIYIYLYIYARSVAVAILLQETTAEPPRASCAVPLLDGFAAGLMRGDEWQMTTSDEHAEINGKQAYDMLVQDLTAQIDQETQDREDKFGIDAEAQGDLTITTTAMGAIEEYLAAALR